MGAGSNLGEGLIFASFCLLKEGGIYPTGYPAEKLSYEGERMLWKNKAIYLVEYCYQDALGVLFIQLISKVPTLEQVSTLEQENNVGTVYDSGTELSYNNGRKISIA